MEKLLPFLLAALAIILALVVDSYIGVSRWLSSKPSTVAVAA